MCLLCLFDFACWLVLMRCGLGLGLICLVVGLCVGLMVFGRFCLDLFGSWVYLLVMLLDY